MADPRLGIPHYREIDINEIKDWKSVGRGSFGTVYKAQWQEQYVAVKEFDLEADRKAIDTEVKQLSRVRHRNIIALYGVSRIHSRICLVMEYAEGGSLYNFLHGKPKPYYSAGHAMSWALQCAEGVAYLHAMRPKPLIHRDLKPPNLLLVDKGRTLKICDFGTVADKSTLMTNNKGSAAWMAPEVFETSAYTEKCDLFSWGIILWEVLSREQPFKEIGHTYSIMWRVHKGQRPPLIEGCPKPIEKLMTSCWDPNPSNRPSMEYVVKIMRILCKFFPGADDPLDCIGHLQLDYYEDEENLTTIDSNQLTFESFSNSELNTPTNSTEIMPITQSINQHYKESPAISNQHPVRWGNEYERIYGPMSSQINEKGNENKRNGIFQTPGIPLQPLTVEVDPNAWELNQEDYNSIVQNIPKSEGKERLTVTETAPVEESSECTDVGDDTDSSLHLMLDPELQPESPDPNNRLSQEIFQEHQKLAKEYLRVDTELYYARDRKEKILASMNPEEKQEKLTIIKKIMEKDDLLEFYNDLKQQLEKIQAAQRTNIVDEQQPFDTQPQKGQGQGQQQTSSEEPPDQNDEGWVFIPSNHS